MFNNTSECDKIKLVALDLFSRYGFAGSSVRHIAKEVGIRESAIYNHFSSKDAILFHHGFFVPNLLLFLGVVYTTFSLMKTLTKNQHHH